MRAFDIISVLLAAFALCEVLRWKKSSYFWREKYEKIQAQAEAEIVSEGRSLHEKFMKEHTQRSDKAEKTRLELTSKIITSRTVQEGSLLSDAYLDMREKLMTLRLDELGRGTPMFLKIPVTWYDGKKYRCPNGHISTTVLKSEALGRDACLACYEPVMITFPDDVDGPL